MDSMEQCRKFYGNMPLIPWNVSVDFTENMPLIPWKVSVDSMENLPSIPREISTKQSRTVSHQCTHWFNMTETLLIEILFTFDNTIKF